MQVTENSMQMSKDRLEVIDAMASRSPVWQINSYIQLVSNGLQGVSQEVAEQAEALLIKLNGLAVQQTAPAVGPAASTTFLAPQLRAPETVYLDPSIQMPVFEHRKAA